MCIVICYSADLNISMKDTLLEHAVLLVLSQVWNKSSNSLFRSMQPILLPSTCSLVSKTLCLHFTNLQSIKTRAVLNEAGTHYVLNGSKIWISNGGIAEVSFSLRGFLVIYFKLIFIS